MTTTDFDDTMLDEEWLAAPRQRSRLRLALVAALVAAVCFLGGALAQKQFGVDSAAAGPAGLPSGIPEGFAGGELPGFQADADTDDQTGEADDQVIGTVVSKKDGVWVIEDLGGERHQVIVAKDTDVVRETTLTPSKVRAGDRVQITGTARGDRLRAADITLR